MQPPPLQAPFDDGLQVPPPQLQYPGLQHTATEAFREQHVPVAGHPVGQSFNDALTGCVPANATTAAARAPPKSFMAFRRGIGVARIRERLSIRSLIFMSSWNGRREGAQLYPPNHSKRAPAYPQL